MAELMDCVSDLG